MMDLFQLNHRAAYIKSFIRAAERAISAAGRQRTQPDKSDKE